MRELSLEKIRKRRRHFVQDLKTASVWAFQIFVYVCLHLYSCGILVNVSVQWEIL